MKDLELADSEGAGVVYEQPIRYPNIYGRACCYGPYREPTPEDIARREARAALIKADADWRSMLPKGDYPYGP